MRVRVRWSQAGLAILGVAGLLLALQVAPSLLKPPKPPPLPADVGLPRVEAEVPAKRGVGRWNPRSLGRVVSGGGSRRRAEASEGRAPSQAAHSPGARRSAQRKPRAP